MAGFVNRITTQTNPTRFPLWIDLRSSSRWRRYTNKPRSNYGIIRTSQFSLAWFRVSNFARDESEHFEGLEISNSTKKRFCYCARIGMDHSVNALPSIKTIEGGKCENRSVPSRMPSRSAQIHLVSCHSEVYEPCDDSFALVDALLADRTNLIKHQPMFCMEVGCGSGYVITSLAIMLGQEGLGVHFFATDTNPHAVRVTQETMEAHGVHVEVICDNVVASGLEKRLGGKVDVMVVNPPYVPTPEDEVGRDGIASAWAGGENGRTVIDKILPIADKLLSDKGWLYMVTLAANNPSQVCRVMREKGFASRIVVQRSTEEESLHIIKFWRDADIQVTAKDPTTLNRGGTPAATVMDSLFSQFPRLSFWRNNTTNHNLDP